MPNFIDLTGQKFGYLTVIRRSDNINKEYVAYECLCDCGKIKKAKGCYLKNGVTSSCGCKTKEKLHKRNITHGLSKTSPVYSMWEGMKQRCYNPNSTAYYRYGARGIFMCDLWKNNFGSFHKWCMKNGWKKGLDLDRKDNDGIYEPRNCRFVTKQINSRNRSTNKYLTFNGQTLCLQDWALCIGIHPCTLSKRLEKWPLEKALTIGKINKYDSKSASKNIKRTSS